jgi:hypothetical protein
MKRAHLLIATATAACALWTYLVPPFPTVLSVGLGHTFEQVAQSSSFSVVASSDIPPRDAVGFGATWVTRPAVIVRFDDPQFGFSLAPTTFAAIGYMHNKVDTITTSPMLKKLTFDSALIEVARLQNIFQSQGWQLDDDTTWFDLTPVGRVALHSNLRLSSTGYCKWVSLRVPQKYSMIFRMRCSERCDSSMGLDRYLIDISIGRDFESNIQDRKKKPDAGNLHYNIGR